MCSVCSATITVEFVDDAIEAFEIMADGEVRCVKDKQNGGTYVYCSENQDHDVSDIASQAIELCESA